jgi:hypothetical protein
LGIFVTAVNIVAWRAIVVEMRATIAVADPLAAANLAQIA